MLLLRQVLREVGARPGVTAVGVSTIALGIAVNTVVFSGVYPLLLRPLPYPGADRLVSLGQLDRQGTRLGLSLRDLQPWQDGSNPVFEEVAASRSVSVNLELPGTRGSETERVTGAVVTEGLLPMLDGRPVRGRRFAPADFERGDAGVVLLSHGLWARRLGGDPAVLGETLLLDGVPHAVVGVMPEDFRYPIRAALWLPLSPAERAEALAGSAPSYDVLARLRPGIDRERARAELVPWLARSARARGENADGIAPAVDGLREGRLERFQRAALLMQVAVALVLLIACANLAALISARHEERRTELAIRLALGSSAGRLVRLLLGEAVALGVLGCVLGIVLAHWGLGALRTTVPWPSVGIPEPRLDLPVLASAVGLSLVTAIVAGLAPSLRAARRDVAATLAEGASSGTASPGARRRGGRLASLQMAFATGLLVSTGLSVQAFVGLTLQDPGFEVEGGIALQVFTPSSGQSEVDGAAYVESLLDDVAAIPGVEAAGLVGYMPLVGYNPGATLLIDGPASADPRSAPRVDYQPVSPGYLRAMGIPVVEGRGFGQHEGVSARVALVNQTLARRYWPGASPLGRAVWLPEHAEGEPFTVVGVVGDIRQFGLAAEPRPEVYVLGQRESLSTLVARAGSQTPAVMASLRAELARRRGDGVAFRLGTLPEFVADHLERRRIFLRLLSVFAAMALGLAVLGVYGMSAYRVSRSGREFGVRQALGARAGDIVRLVLGESLRVGLAGLALGLLVALGLGGALRSVVAGVGSTSIRLLLALSALVPAVSVAASYLPARRAARVDPAKILRGGR